MAKRASSDGRAVQLEYRFDRSLIRKLEQAYQLLVPEIRRPVGSVTLGCKSRLMGAVQDDSRRVFPVFFEIPKLHAFEGAAFHDEVDDLGLSFRGNAIADNQFIERSVSVVNDHALDENGVAHSQLNRAKRAVPKADRDPVVILRVVDMSVAQEVPDLAPGVKGGIEDEGQEHHKGQDNLLLQNFWAPVPLWFCDP